jgi:hypothetical protein
MSQVDQTAILDRILDPVTSCLTPDVAAKLVALRADDETQARVDALAEKSNEGTISPEERQEYDRYRDAFHFMTILQAKARKLLNQSSLE